MSIKINDTVIEDWGILNISVDPVCDHTNKDKCCDKSAKKIIKESDLKLCTAHTKIKMYKDIELSASLMCANWLSLKDQILSLEENDIDYMHYDIADGIYAPDFTMGSSIVDLIQKTTSIKSDFHLMVDEPSRVFNSFTAPKDSYFTIHQEACRNLYRDIIWVKQNRK